MDIQLFIPILTATLMCFGGCGDSKSADDSCGDSFVSNVGQPQNSRGYYGDEVCFGGKKVVGKWQLFCYWNDERFDSWIPPVCGDDHAEYIDLKSDGTTQQYNLDGTLSEYYSIPYGVNESGTRLGMEHVYNNGHGSEALYFTYLETNTSYPNCLLTRYTNFNLLYGDTQTNEKYWLCKVDE